MYPNAITCEQDICRFHGCQADTECPSEFADRCVIEDGNGRCEHSCTTDMDCLPPELCTGGGGTYCERPPCSTDEDCIKTDVCDLETGECVQGLECIDATSCLGSGACIDGWCVCECDAACGEGRICVPTE
jgi:hypothetical protein